MVVLAAWFAAGNHAFYLLLTIVLHSIVYRCVPCFFDLLPTLRVYMTQIKLICEYVRVRNKTKKGYKKLKRTIGQTNKAFTIPEYTRTEQRYLVL